MLISQLGCCAVQELEKTSGMSPKEILSYFCNDYIHRDHYPNGTWVEEPKEGAFGELPGFVIFTGLVKGGNTTGWGDANSTSQLNLARYIRKYKLGRLTTLRANYNRVNEPDHLVKVWLWSPAQRAMEKWYVKTHPDEKITIGVA